MSNIDISLIIPAYNEVASIARTIGEARAYFARRQLTCEIIVAADGDDGTRELVADMAKADSLLVGLGSAERRGKGYGVRQAVARASGVIIGFTDADDKTPIGEFDKVEPHLRAGAKVVIGSRRMRDSHIEQAQRFYRRMGSLGFAAFMHLVVGLRDISDTQCGFKFFQGAVARDLFARQVIDGYMFDVEILYLARRAGYTIVQVPVHWRDDGDSRLAVWSGNFRSALDIFRIRLRGVPRTKK